MKYVQLLLCFKNNEENWNFQQILWIKSEKKFSLDFMFSKKKLSYKIAATNVC